MGSFFNADEVFEMAMDIEKSGESYYRKAAGRMENPKVKELMDYLADEEQKHHQVFAGLRGSLPQKLTTRSMPDPEDQERLYLDALVKSRLFTGDQEAERVAASMDGELEALKTALNFEKDTILFFIAMKDMTPEKLGREKIDLLINEEHTHVVKISKEIKNLT
ncbi:MAG: ferritin family protein [Candidatus Krumholzibacteriota bacterium]|nr:ferritin family protein [Candidatus Krumholzibacteriota bacterium]